MTCEDVTYLLLVFAPELTSARAGLSGRLGGREL
jgi:hypothetical protein